MEQQSPVIPVPSALLRLAPLIEEALRGFFAKRSFPLYRMVEYQLGWRDERGAPLELPLTEPRVYASLCLLACQACGGDPRRALPSAIAVELAHQFSQAHADVQEGSQQRHGRPTIWWVWGPAQAINAGDALHALARLSLLGEATGDDANPDTSLRLLQTLDNACLRLCEGMYQEMAFQERVDVLPAAYQRMAKEKAGALLGCALELGARTAGAGESDAVLWRDFGEELGVAYQTQEDVQMLWGRPLSGKDFGLDVLNKKKGYPIILALEQASLAQKRELGTLFFKRVLGPPDVLQVKSILEALDARAKATAAVQALYQKAEAAFSPAVSDPTAKEDVARIARWLALRDSL